MREALQALAVRLGVTLGPGQWARLDAFAEVLLTWNRRVNLTGAGTREQLEDEHWPDAIALAALVPPGSSLVDVGAGGGLPAIPFAVLRPDVTLTLVEPRAKRAAFLRTAARTVGVRADVLGERVEDLGLPPGHFGVASSRATFEPGEWLLRGIELAPLVVVFAARPTATPAGLEVAQQVEYRTGCGHPRWAAAVRRAAASS